MDRRLLEQDRQVDGAGDRLVEVLQFASVALPHGWRPAGRQRVFESGQAWVYEVARDNGAVCALKRLKNPARRERFRREIETMLRLRERGITVIPAIVDFDVEAERPWYAMPWYEDGSLEAHVEEGTHRGDQLRGIHLLVQAAKAVETLHREGVAHRDLKPANILLDGDAVVLSDLGLCLVVDEAGRLTETEEAVGSRLYIAPENESGINEADDQRSADFYAFGKILWAVLAGRQPPARERQLDSPWTLQEQLGDKRFGALLPLQSQLLEVDSARRLADWGFVTTALRSFASFLDDQSPLVRDNLAAASGQDGRIYVVGGQPFTGGAFNVLEAYAPESGTWARLEPMPTPRLQLGAACGEDGRIYAIGGQTADGFLRTVEAYDPVADSWERCVDMPTARSDAVVVASRGRIFVIGGLSDVPMILNTVEAYSPETGSWSQHQPMATPRRGAGGALGGDSRIYVVGGRLGPGGAVTTDVVEVYDPVAETWDQVAAMPTPRAWLAAVTAPDGRIYAIGGHNEDLARAGHVDADERFYLKVVEIYDPLTGAWTRGPSLRSGRASHAAAAADDGFIYVVGGASGWLDVLEVIR